MMGTEGPAFDSLADLAAWCAQAPSGTRLEAREIAKTLESLLTEEHQGGEGVRPDQRPAECPSSPDPTWRERLWVVPAETRLGVTELAEALGRPKSYVYARTGPKAGDPIPHRKLDGTLTFTAGEVRAWIREREEEVVGGPMESTKAERGGRLHAL